VLSRHIVPRLNPHAEMAILLSLISAKVHVRLDHWGSIRNVSLFCAHTKAQARANDEVIPSRGFCRHNFE